MNQGFKYLMLLFCVLIVKTQGYGKTGPDKIIDVVKYKGIKIIIGTEGGKAKIRQEKIILRSGQIYDHNIDKNEYKYIKTLTGKDVRHVFSVFSGAPITSYNHPGTTSNYVEEDHNGKISFYYMWGEEGVEVPGFILSGYTEIVKIIN